MFNNFILGTNEAAFLNGLMGYNGILCGCALAVFIETPWSPISLAAVGISSAISTVCSCYHFQVKKINIVHMQIVTIALGNIMISSIKVPPFTLPFNLTTLFFLFGVFRYEFFHFATGFGSSSLIVPSDTDWSLNAGKIFIGWMNGISQVYVIESYVW